MAATEEVASGSNWHVPMWTAVGEIWLQGKSRVYIVQEGILRRMEAAGKECCQRKLSAISKVMDA